MASLNYGTLMAEASRRMVDAIRTFFNEWMNKGFMQSGFSRRIYGNDYEKRAENFLREQGYRFLDRNVNYKSGEIDLVFEHGTGKGIELVFVEVRKRDPRGFIQAEESITFPKERRLRSAIRLYLAKYQGRANTVSIDLIAFKDDELIHYPGFLGG